MQRQVVDVERTKGLFNPNPKPFQCAQLEAAQLNGELARWQGQVADVERTYRRLHKSYRARKRGEKELMGFLESLSLRHSNARSWTPRGSTGSWRAGSARWSTWSARTAA